jgi:hypothetical protein
MLTLILSLVEAALFTMLNKDKHKFFDIKGI